MEEKVDVGALSVGVVSSLAARVAVWLAADLMVSSVTESDIRPETAETHVAAGAEYDAVCCRFLPPTAPPTAAPMMTQTTTVATTKKTRGFMPKMIRGGRMLESTK